MKFDHQHYVPCLRWKTGEYQAVLGLSPKARTSITPLIEVPEMPFDFEKWVESKTVDEHLAPFAKRVRTKWGTAPCFVDAQHIASDKLMSDGRHPLAFLLDSLRSARCAVVPVSGLSRTPAYQTAAADAISKDGRGICLRVGIEEPTKPGFSKAVDGFLGSSGVGVDQCDLILDLGAPNFEPVGGFAKLVEAIVLRLPYLAQWRTFTLMGTAFPSTMAEIKRSPTLIKRSEWLLYNALVKSLATRGVRLPSFGDYAINHPQLLSLDMRLVKPSATIRYTTDDGWFIVKGPNVRDNGYEQYRDHCRTVMASGVFTGRRSSDGDKYIAACAAGAVGTGNLTTWRKVGTSHHLEKVVQDISTLFGTSSSP